MRRMFPAAGMMAALVAMALLGHPARAELQVADRALQGALIHGQADQGSTVRANGRQLRLTQDGRFVIGVGRDATGVLVVEAALPDGRSERRDVAIEARSYDIQRIDGLPPKSVEPSKEDLARIQAEQLLLNQARARDSAALGFTEQVTWPVRGRISGVYGSQRILNGQPRSPHRGLDVAAPEGEPIGAMAGGVVSLAKRDMYFTGGTVMVDHGHGVQSIYAHLSSVEVEVGQEVRQAEIIGKVGATGRATGPHLHWGVYWFDEAVDPALLEPPPAN